MNKPMIRIHNADTGETIDREMTKEELNDYLTSIEITNAQDKKEKDKRNGLVAKLTSLGLTEDEIAAL